MVIYDFPLHAQTPSKTISGQNPTTPIHIVCSQAPPTSIRAIAKSGASETGRSMYHVNTSANAQGSTRQLVTLMKRHSSKNKPHVEKPLYNCEIMGDNCPWRGDRADRFKNAAQVKEDILRHFNIFQCPRCKVTFGKSNGLKRHQERTAKCIAGINPPKRGEDVTPGQKEMLQRLQDAKGIDNIRDAIKGWQNKFQLDNPRTSSSSKTHNSKRSIKHSSPSTPDTPLELQPSPQIPETHSVHIVSPNLGSEPHSSYPNMHLLGLALGGSTEPINTSLLAMNTSGEYLATGTLPPTGSDWGLSSMNLESINSYTSMNPYASLDEYVSLHSHKNPSAPVSPPAEPQGAPRPYTQAGLSSYHHQHYQPGFMNSASLSNTSGNTEHGNPQLDLPTVLGNSNNAFLCNYNIHNIDHYEGDSGAARLPAYEPVSYSSFEDGVNQVLAYLQPNSSTTTTSM